MHSCSSDRDHAGAAARTAAYGAKYQPCNTATTTTWAAVQAAGQVVPSEGQLQRPPPRPPSRRHSASSSASRRSSTTVVSTDVSNFRAMVQELTGFPPAAIFRPQPRRAHTHAATASHSLLSAAHGCGGALQGRSSDAAAAAATAAANGRANVPAVAQAPLMMYPQPGVFDLDGLADLGSPEFDAWPDLSFE